MLKRFKQRTRDEEGFTLIELMVVVLIIGILIAIALPTFLGARQRAQDRGAQSNLRNGVAAAKVFFTDSETYVGFDATAADAIEPSLNWAAAGAPTGDQVTLGGPAAILNQIQLVSLSASGTYFCIKDVTSTAGGLTPGTFYGSGAAYANVDTAGECNGASW